MKAPAPRLLRLSAAGLLAACADRLRLVTLPSSSPAHASLRFEQKAEAWGVLRDALG